VGAYHSANKGTDLATMVPKQFFEDLLPLGLSVFVEHAHQLKSNSKNLKTNEFLDKKSPMPLNICEKN
jgi:hypothetical protein